MRLIGRPPTMLLPLRCEQAQVGEPVSLARCFFCVSLDKSLNDSGYNEAFLPSRLD